MISAERAHLQIAALTHPGMSGKNNEDRYAVSAFHLESEPFTPVVFAIISDGIGGHRAGEVAAEMVVETVSQAIAKSDALQPIQTLREAIMRSSQEIALEAESDAEKKGMGATCACALVIGERLYTATVGDSRLYLLRGGSITQISIDHTWVQEAVEAGVIAAEDAKTHPNAHVIRRYLGSKQPVEPDTRLRLAPTESAAQSEANQGLQLLPGDQILLCSDGLTDLVGDGEIMAALQNQEQQNALHELVELANQRGGHDNITLIALRLPAHVHSTLPETLVLAPQPVQQATPSQRLAQTVHTAPKRKSNLWLLLLIALLLLALLAALAGGAYWLYARALSTPGAQVTQPVTPTAQATAAPGGTEAAPGQPTPISPSGSDSTPPSIPTPLITLTPWPTNTRAP